MRCELIYIFFTEISLLRFLCWTNSRHKRWLRYNYKDYFVNNKIRWYHEHFVLWMRCFFVSIKRRGNMKEKIAEIKKVAKQLSKFKNLVVTSTLSVTVTELAIFSFKSLTIASCSAWSFSSSRRCFKFWRLWKCCKRNNRKIWKNWCIGK